MIRNDTRSTLNDYQAIWRNRRALRECPTFNPDDDGLSAARGILLGCAIVLSVWFVGLLMLCILK